MRGMIKSSVAAAVVLLLSALGVVVGGRTNNGTQNPASLHTQPATAILRKPTSASPRSTQTARPNAGAPTAAQFNGALQDCVLVDNKAGDTVGCVMKTQILGETPPPANAPGLPVYDQQGGALVGYLVAGDGFVAAAVSNNPVALAHLTTCISQLGSGVLDGNPKLAACTAALKAQGFTDPAADAHNARLMQERLTEQRSTTPAP